ncbi:hypothetical protein [Nocardioides conyzicola]|uniref:LysM domain-containing protein n=1 Tax=Nocardioides conyzicola TaxID=1651781 RepID=A0ABP8WZ34_9ACTN
MISSQQASPARCAAVGVASTAAAGSLVAWLLPIALAPGAGTFDTALVRLCAALAVVAAGWLWLASVATVLAARRGRAPHAGVPAPLRRAVLAACGVALTGGLVAGPAGATPGRLHEDRVARPAASAVAGLPLPDRATAAPTVRVVPGDTLWAIAARTLGPGATDAEIDACWRRLYDLNRAAIGPDPDLIHPAQRLEVLP